MASSSSSLPSRAETPVTIRKKVAVLGIGAFAQGLVSLVERSGGASEYELCFGTRRAHAPTPPAAEAAAATAPTYLLPNLSAPVLSIEEALKGAHIVILALPAAAFVHVVAAHADALAAADAIVDCSNPSSQAELSALLGAGGGDDDDKMDAVEIGSASRTLSAAECLRGAICKAATTPGAARSKPPVVKAFNTLSAYALLHGDPLTDAMRSVAASDDAVALAHVKRLGAAMGVDLRCVRSLAYARRLERRHGQLFPEWHDSLAVMMATFALVMTYSVVRYNGFGKKPWVHIFIYILNKGVSWVSLWGMAYAYLPGILITVWQLVAWRRSVRVPRWMKRWLDARKQLGLLALLATALHLALSIFLWMPAYYPKLWQPLGPTGQLVLVSGGGLPSSALGAARPPSAAAASAPALLNVYGLPPQSIVPRDALHATAGFALPASGPPAAAIPPAVVFSGNALLPASVPGDAVVVSTGSAITLASKLNWRGELSTLTGVLAGFGMALTAGTSAPSVTPKLGWREWRLMQSRLGWASVLLATLHVLVLGAPDWIVKQHTWPKGMPTITLLSTVPVMVMLAAKLLLSVPPLSMLVRRARRNAPPSINAPAYAV